MSEEAVKSSSLAKSAGGSSAADSRSGRSQGWASARHRVRSEEQKPRAQERLSGGTPAALNVHQPRRTKQKRGRMKREEWETGR